MGAEIWGFWRDLKNGWENSTRLKSKNTVFVTLSDMLGLVSLTAVSIIDSILHWQQIQTILDNLVEVRSLSRLIIFVK